jgi:hypothetical protein
LLLPRPNSRAAWTDGNDGRIVHPATDYQKNNRFPVVLKLKTGTANNYFVGFNQDAEINADNKEANDQLPILQSGSHG